MVNRNSTHELILEPERTAIGADLRLSSTGRSHYRGAEVGVRYVHASNAELNVTYARSAAAGDLNAFTTYFDAVLWPIVGENMYTRASTDVPHRLTARGRLLPTDRWLLLGIFDWRTGQPYSVVDDALDFVGIRNSERFPTYQRLEVGIERRFKIGKFRRGLASVCGTPSMRFCRTTFRPTRARRPLALSTILNTAVPDSVRFER